MSWDWQYMLSAFPIVLRGLWITVLATVGAYTLALMAGLAIAFIDRVRLQPVRVCLHGVVHFIRGTPLLVQLFCLFYILPYFNIILPALLCGILGMGLHYATYLSQVFRASINAVPPLQWEAARACNLTAWQAWRHIVLPQAVKPALPVLGNYFVALLKETPLLSSITVMDMMGEASTFGDMHYRYLEPITVVGILFLITGLVGRFLVGAARRLQVNPV